MAVDETTTPSQTPTAPAKQLTTVGTYSLKQGKKAVNFWPLSPDFLNVVYAAPKLEFHVAPSAKKGKKKEWATLVPPPQFGIFDIIVRLTDDEIDTDTIAESELLNKMFIGLQGKPTIREMELTPDKDGDCRICFAVQIAAVDKTFEGTLHLTTTLKSGHDAAAELPIQVEKSKKADDMFVFFVAHRNAKTMYSWCKLNVVAAADVSPLEGVEVKTKILRDNGTFKDPNRRVVLTSYAEGFVGYKEEKRQVLGFPTEWPILCNAAGAGYVDRGHMFRFAKNETKDNLHPIAAPPARFHIRMTTVEDAKAALAEKKILLDPGHGVAYAMAENRRCQEWYSASRLADHIQATLEGTFGIKPENIHRTRTAGIALIVPNQVHAGNAPEAGAKLFRADFSDPQNRTVSITAAAAKPLLNSLADLLLTGDDDKPANISASRRLDLIKQNADTMADAADVTISGLKLGWAITDGSFTWNGTDGFTFGLQRSHPHKGVAKGVGTGSISWDGAQYMCEVDSENLSKAEEHAVAAPFPVLIKKDHAFTIDPAMLEALISRTARWSMAKEVGTSDVDDTFVTRATEAMKASDALSYMKERIRAEMDIGKGIPKLEKLLGGWSPTSRMIYFGKGPACDFYITLHENAGGGIGGCVLIQRKDAEGAPPDQQVRHGKIWLKYLDPFDQGLRQGGLAPEAFKKDGTLNKAGMLRSGNPILQKFVYFELEFMDTDSPADPDVLQYAQMTQEDYYATVSQQIVAGLVETLLDKQEMGAFDKVIYRGQINNLW